MKTSLSKKLLMMLLSAIFALSFAACGTTDEGTADESTADSGALPTEIAQADWVDAKQSVDLSTGITMKYVEMGQEDGDPLILVHGMTDNSRAWSLMAPYMADKYHIYMIDLRGHGDTDKPDMGMYSTNMYASDIASFMDELGIEKADIVGRQVALERIAHIPAGLSATVFRPLRIAYGEALGIGYGIETVSLGVRTTAVAVQDEHERRIIGQIFGEIEVERTFHTAGTQGIVAEPLFIIRLLGCRRRRDTRHQADQNGDK